MLLVLGRVKKIKNNRDAAFFVGILRVCVSI